MIKIYYSLGGGGHWLKSSLELRNVTDKIHVSFHEYSFLKNIWITIDHISKYNGDGLLYSGSFYFNFFVNHVYKFWHHDQDIFNTNSYDSYFLKLVACAYEICQSSAYEDQCYFKFDDLLNRPHEFYNKLIQLQQNNNRPVLEYEDFLFRKRKFVESCVCVDKMVENFDNMIWVAFVLGQLMMHKIYPNFDIKNLGNQELCKQFAKDNYHFCQLKNYYNFDDRIVLPKFKNLQ